MAPPPVSEIFEHLTKQAQQRHTESVLEMKRPWEFGFLTLGNMCVPSWDCLPVPVLRSEATPASSCTPWALWQGEPQASVRDLFP